MGLHRLCAVADQTISLTIARSQISPTTYTIKISDTKYRDSDGLWRTAITLPEEIYIPITRAVLDELVERGLTARPGVAQSRVAGAECQERRHVFSAWKR